MHFYTKEGEGGGTAVCFQLDLTGIKNNFEKPTKK